MQYGIRLSKEDIAFGEFCRLLKGLAPDTPLGRVVAVRAEKNPDVIKGFGPYEKKLRKEWRERFLGQAAGRDWQADIVGLQNTLERAFGGR